MKLTKAEGNMILRSPRAPDILCDLVVAVCECFDVTRDGHKSRLRLREKVALLKQTQTKVCKGKRNAGGLNPAYASPYVRKAYANTFKHICDAIDELFLAGTGGSDNVGRAQAAGMNVNDHALFFFAPDANSAYGSTLFNIARDLSVCQEHAPPRRCVDMNRPSFVVGVGSRFWVGDLGGIVKFLKRLGLVVSNTSSFLDTSWLDALPNTTAYGFELVPWLMILKLQIDGPHAIVNTSVVQWQARVRSRPGFYQTVSSAKHWKQFPGLLDSLVWGFDVSRVATPGCGVGAGSIVVAGGPVTQDGAVRLVAELAWKDRPLPPFVDQKFSVDSAWEKQGAHMHDARALALAFASVVDEALFYGLSGDKARQLREIRFGRLAASVRGQIVRVLRVAAGRALVSAFACALDGALWSRTVSAIGSTKFVHTALARSMQCWSPAELSDLYERGSLDSMCIELSGILSSVATTVASPLISAVLAGCVDSRTAVVESFPSLGESHRKKFQKAFRAASRVVGVPGSLLGASSTLTSVVPFSLDRPGRNLVDAAKSVASACGCGKEGVVFIGLPSSVDPLQVPGYLADACGGSEEEYVVVPYAGMVDTAPFAFVLVASLRRMNAYFRYAAPAQALSLRVGRWANLDAYDKTDTLFLPLVSSWTFALRDFVGAPSAENAGDAPVSGWSDVLSWEQKQANEAICFMAASLLGGSTTPGSSTSSSVLLGAFGLMADVASDETLGSEFASQHPWGVMARICASVNKRTLSEFRNTPDDKLEGVHCLSVILAAIWSCLSRGACLVAVQIIVDSASSALEVLGNEGHPGLVFMLRALVCNAHSAAHHGTPLQMLVSANEFFAWFPEGVSPFEYVDEGDFVRLKDTEMSLASRVVWAFGHPDLRARFCKHPGLLFTCLRAVACVRDENDADTPYFAFLDRAVRPWVRRTQQKTFQNILRQRSVPTQVPPDDPLRDQPCRTWPKEGMWGGAGGRVGDLEETAACGAFDPALGKQKSSAVRFASVFFQHVESTTLFGRETARTEEDGVQEMEDAAYVAAMCNVCVSFMALDPAGTSKSYATRDSKLARCSGSASYEEFISLFADANIPAPGQTPISPIVTARGGMSCPLVLSARYPHTIAQPTVNTYYDSAVAGANKGVLDPFSHTLRPFLDTGVDCPVLTPYVMDLPIVDSTNAGGVLGFAEEFAGGRSVSLPRFVLDLGLSLGRMDNGSRIVDGLPNLCAKRFDVSPVGALGLYAMCAVSVLGFRRTPCVVSEKIVDAALGEALTGIPSPPPFEVKIVKPNLERSRKRVFSEMEFIRSGSGPALGEDRAARIRLASGRVGVSLSLDLFKPSTRIAAPGWRARKSLAWLKSLGMPLPKKSDPGVRFRRAARQTAMRHYRLTGDPIDAQARVLDVAYGPIEEIEKRVEEGGPRSLMVCSSDITKRRWQRRMDAMEKKRKEEKEKARRKAELRAAIAAVPRSAMQVPKHALSLEESKRIAETSVFINRRRDRKKGGRGKRASREAWSAVAEKVRKRKRSDRDRERRKSDYGNVLVNTEDMRNAVLNTKRLLDTMGPLSVESMVQTLAPDLDEIAEEVGITRKKEYVFDAPCTVKTMMDDCEPAFALAGLYTSFHDQILKIRDSCHHAGAFLTASLRPFFGKDNVGRQRGEYSESTLDDMISAADAAGFGIPEDVVESSISSGEIFVAGEIILPSIAKSRVATFLRFQQDENVRDEIISKLYALSSLESQAGATCVPVSTRETLTDVSDNALSPPYIPQSPTYAPAETSVADMEIAEAFELDGQVDLKNLDTGGFKNEFIRTLRFAEDIGIDTDGSMFGGDLVEGVSASIPEFNPYICLVCRRQDKVDTMEVLCPCKAHCHSAVVHFGCAVGKDFYDKVVIDMKMKSPCGCDLPDYLLKFRAAGQYGEEDLLREILHAEFEQTCIELRMVKSGMIEGSSRKTPRERVGWGRISYDNWRRHPKYIQMRDALIQKAVERQRRPLIDSRQKSARGLGVASSGGGITVSVPLQFESS